jgi:hypothetical protein
LASFEGFDTARVPAPASSRLIADGDSVARNAFRVGLREDTPLPIASLGHDPHRAGITQELDPADILEVQDMAEAIARAEMLVLRTPLPVAPAPRSSSGPDMFESLGRRDAASSTAATVATARTRMTDDAVGPATPAPPYVATPIPPAPTSPTLIVIPAAPTALDDDAFYHPLGRMRSLADVTLDGYRPEPTLLVRAASRRKRFSWVLLAALIPLVGLAAVAISANVDTTSATSTPRVALAPARGASPATSITPLATTSVRAKSTGADKHPASTPVFDVNSLPAASSGGARALR